MDAYIGHATLYCAECADEECDGPYANGGGEADTPQHCGACHLFLENPLTRDGEEYVREAYDFAVAEERVDSVVITEWVPFYDYLNFELAED